MKRKRGNRLIIFLPVFTGLLVCAGALSTAEELQASPLETEQALKRALAATPDDMEAVASYVRFLNRRDRMDDAVAVIRPFETRNDGLMWLLRAEIAWAQDDAAAARNAVTAIPSSTNNPWKCGQELLVEMDYIEGRTAECAELCRQLLEADPLNKTARLFRARSAMKHGDYYLAQSMLDVADTAHAGDLEVLECKAELLDAQGRDSDARKLRQSFVDKINASPPSTLRSVLAAAAAMRGIGEWNAAQQCQDLALAYAPNDPFGLLEKCRLYRETSAHTVSANAAAAALSHHKNFSEACTELAESLFAQKYEASRVEPLCRQALEIDPAQIQARCRLIWYALVAGDYERAREMCAENAQVNPSDLDNNALREAASLLEQNAETPAVSEGDGSVRLAATMGELCAARREYRRSRAWFASALSQDKKDPRILRGAGLAALHCGEVPEAKELLEGAFALNGYDIGIKNTLDFLDDFEGLGTISKADFTVGFGKKNAAAAEYALYLTQVYFAEESKRFGVSFAGPLRVQLCTKDDLNVLSLGVPACTSCGGPAGPDGVLVLDAMVLVVTPDAYSGRDQTVRFDESLHRGITECLLQRADPGGLPLWLRDAFARYAGTLVNPEWGPPRADALLAMLREGHGFSLKAQGAQALGESGPLTRTYGALACEAWAERYGPDSITHAWKLIREGMPWTAALEGAFQQPLETIDSETAAGILQRFEKVRIESPGALQPAVLLADGPLSDEAEIERCAFYLALNRYDDVLDGLRGILTKDAPPARALLIAGRASLAKGEIAQARSYLESGMAADQAQGGKFASAKDYEALGFALDKLGETDAAVGALRKAVELNPLDATDEGAGSKLIALLNKNKPREYYETLEIRMPVRRADAQARIELARWYQNQGDSKSALQWYRSAAGLRPGWGEAHLALAPLAEKAAAEEEAYSSYRTVLAGRPKDLRAQQALMTCANKLGLEEDATEFIERIKKPPSSTE